MLEIINIKSGFSKNVPKLINVGKLNSQNRTNLIKWVCL